MTDRDLERAIDRLTETMAEYAVAKVKQALALERDRADAEVAELRDELHTLSNRVNVAIRLGSDPGQCEHGVSFAPGRAIHGKSEWCGTCFPAGLHSVRVEP